MDTSEQYIKMCEKAVEIQKLRKPHNNSWLEGDVYKEGSYAVDIHSYAHYVDPDKKSVWLPRQDQLQDMVITNITPNTDFDIADMLGKFTVWYMEADTCDMYSMEQLWLAFVMKEKYGKRWVNDEWI